MNAAEIAQMNAHYVRVVVNAALEDLVSARLAHGVGSAVYQRQVVRSVSLIEGHLEAVLTAALRELDGRVCSVGAGHDGQ